MNRSHSVSRKPTEHDRKTTINLEGRRSTRVLGENFRNLQKFRRLSILNGNSDQIKSIRRFREHSRRFCHKAHSKHKMPGDSWQREKRARVSAACQPCKLSRTKCSENRPCTRCLSHGRTCFDEDPANAARQSRENVNILRVVKTKMEIF